MDIVIRAIRKEEYPLLNEFLYQAIFIPEGVEPPPFEIVERPELRLYTDYFGSSKHDRAYVAVSGDRVIGAAWARIMNDYGHIDDDTPSLAVSLYPDYRGHGIGTRLMRALLDDLKEAGYAQISLAVQKENYAVKMYRKLGFEAVGENSEEYIMLCRFR